MFQEIHLLLYKKKSPASKLQHALQLFNGSACAPRPPPPSTKGLPWLLIMILLSPLRLLRGLRQRASPASHRSLQSVCFSSLDLRPDCSVMRFSDPASRSQRVRLSCLHAAFGPGPEFPWSLYSHTHTRCARPEHLRAYLVFRPPAYITRTRRSCSQYLYTACSATL